MNFNKILQSLFGNKSTRDMKLIQPIVEKVKAEYPKMNALSNDELRANLSQEEPMVDRHHPTGTHRITRSYPPGNGIFQASYGTA